MRTVSKPESAAIKRSMVIFMSAVALLGRTGLELFIKVFVRFMGVQLRSYCFFKNFEDERLEIGHKLFELVGTTPDKPNKPC